MPLWACAALPPLPPKSWLAACVVFSHTMPLLIVPLFSACCLFTLWLCVPSSVAGQFPLTFSHHFSSSTLSHALLKWLFFPPQNAVSLGNVTFPMLAKVGNEEVGRWVRMSVMYPGNDGLHSSKYMTPPTLPPTPPFWCWCCPRTRGINAYNSEYGIRTYKVKAIFPILILLIAHMYTHMLGVHLFFPTQLNYIHDPVTFPFLLYEDL